MFAGGGGGSLIFNPRASPAAASKHPRSLARAPELLSLCCSLRAPAAHSSRRTHASPSERKLGPSALRAQHPVIAHRPGNFGAYPPRARAPSGSAKGTLQLPARPPARSCAAARWRAACCLRAALHHWRPPCRLRHCITAPDSRRASIQEPCLHIVHSPPTCPPTPLARPTSPPPTVRRAQTFLARPRPPSPPTSRSTPPTPPLPSPNTPTEAPPTRSCPHPFPQYPQRGLKPSTANLRRSTACLLEATSKRKMRSTSPTRTLDAQESHHNSRTCPPMAPQWATLRCPASR